LGSFLGLYDYIDIGCFYIIYWGCLFGKRERTHAQHGFIYIGIWLAEWIAEWIRISNTGI
jgi:hypothetical protein